MKASQLPAHIILTELLLNRKVQHWAGLAFVFGNILFVVNKLDEMSRLFLSRPMRDVISGRNPGLILLGQIALMIGYVGYYQFYAPRASRSGKYALRLLCSGGALLAIGHVGFMSAIEKYVPTSLLGIFSIIWGKTDVLHCFISFGCHTYIDRCRLAPNY